MLESVYQFRTALGGYHKGDVTAYIEMTASEHRSELLERERTITELQKENRSLQQQLNLLMLATPTAAPEPEPAPEPVPEPAPEPIPEPAPVQPTDVTTLELQAYRRAEAVEHAAHLRAKQLYQQLEGLCTDTLAEFQVTDAAVKQAIDGMLRQAKDLEQAYQALSSALVNSREKLASMNVPVTDDDKD